MCVYVCVCESESGMCICVCVKERERLRRCVLYTIETNASVSNCPKRFEMLLAHSQQQQQQHLILQLQLSPISNVC